MGLLIYNSMYIIAYIILPCQEATCLLRRF